MKFKITCFVMILLVSFTTLAYGIDVMVNTEKVMFDNDSGKPFLDANKRTQVPLRKTMEKFGAKVNWDESSNTAIVEKNNIMVKIPIGKNYILVNDKQVANDTAAIVKNGKTYLPIRAVAEALGAKVFWDNDTSTVILSTNTTNMYVVDATGENKGFKWIKNHELTKLNVYYNQVVDGSMVMRQTRYSLAKKVSMDEKVKWVDLNGKNVTSTRGEIYDLISYYAKQSSLYRRANPLSSINPYQDSLEYIRKNLPDIFDDWSASSTSKEYEVGNIVEQYLDGFKTVTASTDTQSLEKPAETTPETTQPPKKKEIKEWYTSKELSEISIYISSSDYRVDFDYLLAMEIADETGHCDTNELEKICEGSISIYTNLSSKKSIKLDMSKVRFENYPYQVNINGVLINIKGPKLEDIEISGASLLEKGLISE